MLDDIPLIRPTQFEGESVGHLTRSVNMFRGDVNFTKSLIELPGKPGDATLAVAVSIQCQSNVSQQATLWNLDAPTGILGLGWTLPSNRIVAVSSGALTPAALSYLLEADGTSNLLIEDDTAWLRVSLDTSESAALQAGTVAPGIVQAFASQGVALSGTATVSATNGGWTIDDDEFEHIFAVELTAAGANVYDGGLSFQLQNFDFSRIAYYPAYERWELTTTAGEIRIYGGLVTRTSLGFKASAGNSIEWGVKWGGDAGSWSGPSQSRATQAQYARAWNLSFRRDLWGSQVTYGYNEFDRGSDGLLGRNAEQAVGLGGLPYTKATYLTSITDIYGRTIAFTYGDKSYTTDAQEYMDPHKELDLAPSPETPPANLSTPNAYQDQYETLYLQQIDVRNADQQLCFSLVFSYLAPCTVTVSTGTLPPSAAKRYLAAIHEVNANGQRLPGFVFDYSLTGPNLGAIVSVTYPQGARATWTYANASLPICDRSVTVDPPSAVGANATPFVWLGEDVVVNVWVSQDETVATLDIFTWIGRWVQWSAETPLYQSIAAPITSASIQAQVNEVSVAISFATASGNTEVFLVGRSPTMPTQWTLPESVSVPGIAIGMSGGTNFIVATGAGLSGEQQLYLWTWNWKSGGWTGLAGPLLTTGDSIFALGYGEYYVTAISNRDGTNLSIAWVDAEATWHAAGTTSFGWTLAYNTEGFMAWAAGPSCVAMSVADDPNGQQYTVQLVRWDADYQFCDMQAFASLPGEWLDFSQGMVWPPVPVVIDTAFVGVRQHLFRFDGAAWQSASFDTSGAGAGWLAFAYGDDVAVQVVNDTSDAVTKLLAYDPNDAGFAASPMLITTALPPGDLSLEGWPSILGGDYLVARNALFYRGSSTDWSGITTNPVFTLPTLLQGQSVNSQSLVNGAPSYLAYRSSDVDPTKDAVQLLVLQNGGVLEPVPAPLAETAYTVAASPWSAVPPSQAPSAPGTLVTWPANTRGLSAAQSFTLYRYAGNAMAGPITDFPVQSLSISDGFGGSYETAYEFLAGSAACDPTGRIVKYFLSASYAGTSDPARSTLGRTVYSYQNGFAVGSTFSMLDGLLAQTAQFEGAMAFTTIWQPALGLDPDAAPNQSPQTVTAALVQAFASGGVILDPSAQIQYLQIDGFYRYWAVTEVTSGNQYNIDYTGMPEDAAGVRVFTGRSVQSTTTGWAVYTARNSDPTVPDATPLPVHGGYARPLWTVARTDGVPLVTEYGYVPPDCSAPFNGGVLARAWSFYNAAGELEQHVDLSTYGAEVNQAMLAANLLSPVVALRHVVTTGGASVTSSASATTWSGWTQSGGEGLTNQAPSQQWLWVGDPNGGDQGVFPFGETPDPGLWRLRSTVHQVSDAGVAIESTDAAGVRHATLYDASGQVEVALASNASFLLGQAMFTSFERYEDLSAWTLAGGATWASGDSRAGAQSASLPVSGSQLERAALSPDASRVQVFSAWYKTSPDYVDDGRSGWTFTIATQGSIIGQPIVLPWTETQGQWTFQSVAIDLPSIVPAGAADVTLTIAAANNTTGSILIDDVTLIPLVAEFVAQVYDPLYRMPIARLDVDGRIWRTIRDGFMREIGGTGPTGVPVALQLSYLSLSGNPAGFSATDPNVSIGVKAFAGGSYQTFQDGDGWSDAWTASPTGALQAAGGILAHADATSSATLTATTTPPDGALALYTDIVPLGGGPLALTDDVSIAIGQAATFTLSAATGQWSLDLDGELIQPLASFVEPLCSCLVLLVGGHLAFYANGQLLFSQRTAITGAPSIVLGKNALGLSNLTLLGNPAAFVRFSDATGAARQSQVLTAEDYLVTQTVRDARGRAVVQTKPAPGLFGSSAALPALVYRGGFVDVASFLGTMDGSGVMAGDVSDWYNGTNDTDDQGYPYSRTVLEPSPLARTIELGFPGQPQAIVDMSTTAPADRPTVQFVYGSNASESVPFLNLPQETDQTGCYQVVTRINQLKVATGTVIDGSRNVIARYTPNAGTDALSLTGPTYGNGQVQVGIVAPDSYVLDSGEQAETRLYNGLGQTVAQQSPDAGATRYLYDAGGRIRFVQDAAAAADGYVVYLTWDALGRMCSRGIVDFVWDQSTTAQLQQYADLPTWPEGQSAVSFTRQRAWLWDGDGSDPTAIGRIARATSMTETGSATLTVTQVFGWDTAGLLKSRQVIVDDGETNIGNYTTTYVYDVQGRLLAMGYPPAAGIDFAQVCYVYDGRDNVLAITDEQGVPFVTYTYNAMGRPIALAYGPKGIAEAIRYDSPGRLLDLSVEAGDATFSVGLNYAVDGMIGSLAEKLDAEIAPFAASVQYDYDALGQFTSATDTDSSRSVTVSYVTPSGATDQNGNIQAIAAGNQAAATLTYAANPNQLASVEMGGETVTYSYLDNGALRQRGSGASALNVEYVPGGLLPAGLSSGNGVTAVFAYDTEGQRVVKQVGQGGAELRVFGGAMGPVLTVAADGTATAWIYGPAGLVAMGTAGQRYSVVSDYLRSPRLVLDADGKLQAAYAFNAFGQTVAAVEPTPGFVPFLFTGQEYDREFGLYNFKTRLYDPAIGRFLAPDPAAQYPSAYCYVGNQPTMLVDPSGQMSALGEAALDTLFAIVLVAAIIGTAGAASAAVPAVAAAAAAASESAAVGVLAGAATSAGIGAIGGAISNTAFQAVYYGVTTPAGNWSWSDFGKELGAAAVGGVVGGAITGGLSGGFAAFAPATTAAASAAEASAAAAEPIDAVAPARGSAPVASESDALLPARDPQPAPAQASAARCWSWANLIRNGAREGGFGAIGGAARGFVQGELTNHWDSDDQVNLLTFTLRNMGTGFIFGAAGGAWSTVDDFYNISGKNIASIKSGFAKEPLWFAVTGLGSTLGSVFAGALFFIRADSLHPYGSNKT